jgi:hypothetical protein
MQGAGYYGSGASTKSRLDEAVFRTAGIEVSYLDYSGCPEYRQMYGAFVHEASIVDP